MSMKRTVFWDVTPRSPVEVHRCIGRLFCLHLQGRRIKKESTQQEADGNHIISLLLVTSLAYSPSPENGGSTFLRNVITSQKVTL
jgi:hypothetical protein